MRTQNAFERERAEGGALPADIKRYKAGKRRPVKSERVSQSGPPFFVVNLLSGLQNIG